MLSNKQKATLGQEQLFNVVHEVRSMLRTTRILIPSIVLSLTILGLAVAWCKSGRFWVTLARQIRPS